jgi:hypothetical protein
MVLRMYIFFWGSLCEAYGHRAIRIAIWDRKKIIVAFATGVWGVNIAFLIQGKSLPPCIGVIKIPVQMWRGIRCYTGEYSSTSLT